MRPARQLRRPALTDNPLLTPWETRYGEPPFSRIKLAHFRPAFDAAIAQWRAEIAAIKARPAGFDNTILGLERAGQTLDRVERVFYHLVGTASSDEIEAIQREIQPRLARESADMLLDEVLFARVEAVHADRSGLDARGASPGRAPLARLQPRRRRPAGREQAASGRHRRAPRRARRRLRPERARRRESLRAGAGERGRSRRSSRRRPRRGGAGRRGARPCPANGRSRCRAPRSSRSCNFPPAATCASRSGAPSSRAAPASATTAR